jgi:lipopolysaccharide heptosyltransferase I
MKKILIVKTSSLGDVIHGLPAASDIRRHSPDAHIDWVVEEAYAPLVALHPAVRRVISVALRRWRRALLASTTWKEIGEFRQSVGAEPYDAVIDLQGLVKSAVVGRAARGRHHGFDASTARERLAACFYEVTHRVARGQHAVPRNRSLAAQALGYRIDEHVDYGITASPLAPPPARPYCVLLHMTSRREKLWPEAAWIEIGRATVARGLDCVLPWGSDEERKRSERIARNLDRAHVPPFEQLDRLAALLGGAAAVVGVDTGLTHLAGALGRPVVAIYCGTDPRLTGVYGARRAKNLGGPWVRPSPEEVLQALESVGAF